MNCVNLSWDTRCAGNGEGCISAYAADRAYIGFFMRGQGADVRCLGEMHVGRDWEVVSLRSNVGPAGTGFKAAAFVPGQGWRVREKGWDCVGNGRSWDGVRPPSLDELKEIMWSREVCAAPTWKGRHPARFLAAEKRALYAA